MARWGRITGSIRFALICVILTRVRPWSRACCSRNDARIEQRIDTQQRPNQPWRGLPAERNGARGERALTVGPHLNRFFDSGLNLCCGCFGGCPCHVSKRDERLAFLRDEVEPIRVAVTPSTLTGATSPTFHMFEAPFI
jgi:hypothetical protein